MVLSGLLRSVWVGCIVASFAGSSTGQCPPIPAYRAYIVYYAGGGCAGPSTNPQGQIFLQWWKIDSNGEYPQGAPFPLVGYQLTNGESNRSVILSRNPGAGARVVVGESCYCQSPSTLDPAAFFVLHWDIGDFFRGTSFRLRWSTSANGVYVDVAGSIPWPGSAGPQPQTCVPCTGITLGDDDHAGGIVGAIGGIRANLDSNAAFIRQSEHYPGLAPFGVTEDLSDGTIWVSDLFEGNLYHYDKNLSLLGSVAVPVMAGTTSTGIAYDPVGDSLWIADYATGVIHEVDKSGTQTGRSLATGFDDVGPATIDPGDSPGRIWVEDIGSDQIVQMELATGVVTYVHANPDNTGSGAFGNGISYDVLDSFTDPGNLVISSGTLEEGQVTRLWSGQPSAAIPRPYVEILDISAASTFINGIQNSFDLNGDPVHYLVDSANSRILEVGRLPAISLCAPGGVNVGDATTLLIDDMESGQQPHWEVGSVGFGSFDWTIVQSTRARSGSSVWFTPDEATITDKSLNLTVDVDVTNTSLEFWHTYRMEAGFDGGVLELSLDGGVTFSDLGPSIYEGGYNGTIDTRFGNPLAGRAAWTGGTLGIMRRVRVDLSAAAGQSGVIVRWREATDNVVSSFGWEIDDVAFTNPGDPCASGPRADVLFVNRTVPTSTLIDDMESGLLPHWGVSTTGFGANDWAIISSGNAQSGIMDWFVADEATISSELLDLTLDIGAIETVLEFYHTFQLESGFDGGVLEVSTDGGATFTDLGGSILDGGYTGSIDTRFGNPLAGRPAWTGGTLGSMTRVRVDLSALANTQGVIVRWFHGSDNSVALAGWEIDTVSITSVGEFTGTGGDDYTIDEFGPDDPLTIRLDESPSRVGDAHGSDAVLYAWIGAPELVHVVVVPKGLGLMCYGPWAVRQKNPRLILNGIGLTPHLGNSTGGGAVPGIPEGGDFEVLKFPSGLGRSVAVTLQGIIEDNCSQGALPYSVTNAVLLVIQ